VGLRDLDAAGIVDPALRSSYELCRRLHAEHGRTYYLATLLLPRASRPYVSALYGFARYADEIVDNGDPRSRERELEAFAGRTLTALESGHTDDPVLRALVHTQRRWGIPVQHFTAFLRSMHMDLTVRSYATFADLERYMYGSAAVIGLQMVPILRPLRADAEVHARELGIAFQLSNFVRDVAEDLARGRLYLPLEDLDRFGVSRAALERGVTTAAIRDLLAFEIERTRAFYRRAWPGIALLHPSSRECITTAFTLYSRILDEVERAGYDVLSRRVHVGMRGRLRVALPAYARARRSWAAA